ncbi:ABC transporter ATP-binding protein [Kyrpidia sp.]|uniref:ABC transporter ATP-binding protein n=1 Tax=Kyrpidia sp. TaxID=2073077 RepID=UPI00179396D3|nr:ABC transporter ATP-binding protein [Kyrpidia sp.]MCL6575056.1 ABC transporter ATP-binding protein [Kyrpidia sp.]HHY67252.1 ABC transporter ATP-binding protein [Alicyclobacillus sp.]
MLKINEIDVYYHKTCALRGLTIEVRPGEIVTLIGANGAGKSTLLRAISGLEKVSAGSIEFEGRNILELSPDRIVRLGIAHVPEGRRIFGRLTVMENLRLGSYIRRDRKAIVHDLERIFSLFPVLRDRRWQYAGTLSGGEQQMLAIARALLAKPKLLLLDEPSLGLAPAVVDSVFDVITEIRKLGVTILMVEQNARMALMIADRGYVLETGSIVHQGTSHELLTDELIAKAYLG